ncbi:hypothetical protein, partial [Enterococcus faecalis]|uniref:hypothetical protein n=1 Tax=Enterococcus faecalis TaxID=1351 RepID=UPI00403F3FA2
QVDGRHYSYHQVPAATIPGWLGAQAPAGARIGYDPWLHTRAFADGVARALAPSGATLVPVAANPVDAIWQDRPAPSAAIALPHD